MSRYKLAFLILSLSLTVIIIAGCTLGSGKPQPRRYMFEGVDVSGSFMNGEYFDDSIDFLAHYIYGHLNNLGGLEVPNVLFVSSIGGARANEP